jgi:molybdopterin-guanine dinucleotide biosynthesis protein B
LTFIAVILLCVFFILLRQYIDNYCCNALSVFHNTEPVNFRDSFPEVWIIAAVQGHTHRRIEMKVIGFAGWSGSGKTTLVEQVIGLLEARGLAVSLIKHAHHEFEVDYPGKDSYRHRHAGCREVLVTSANRWAVMHELRGRPELKLSEALAQLSPCDLVLVEGFKHEPIPKIEVYRAEIGKPQLFPHDPHVIAIASDAPVASALPWLNLNQPAAVAAFILDTLALGDKVVGVAGVTSGVTTDSAQTAGA